MSRLIDADELWEKAKVRVEDNGGLSLPNLYWIIKGLSTVDAEPVRHGKWILKGVREPLPRDYPPCYGEDEYDEDTHSIIVKHWFCSECDYDASDSFKPKDNYCPNCGAKMDGEVNNE